MFMHFKKWFIIFILAFTAIGCSGESASTSNERISLPFDSIRASFNLQVPPGTVGKFAGDGDWPPPMIFDPPVHPLGHVDSLQIEQKDVAIQNTELKDGMLATKDFGEIELVMIGPSQIEFRATRKQIDEIEDWLSKE